SFALAPALEYEIKWRELSGTTWRGGALFRGRSRASAGAHRSLHGQRADSERGSPRRRLRSTWRHQCALHLGGNTARPNELADLRLDAAQIKRRYNSR